MLLRRTDDQRGIVISVSDNGIGMSEEERLHIFDRFFQGQTHPGIMNRGSGVGLSIYQGVCEATRRFHSCKQPVRKGQCVHRSVALTGRGGSGLPKKHLTSFLSFVRVQALPETAVALIPIAHECLTVLLIEDNEDFRTYLRNHLKPYYKVIETVDRREGWLKALSAHPHVIVNDISMPHMDGITLSKKIRADKRTARIPIILLTALTGDTYQLKGPADGRQRLPDQAFQYRYPEVEDPKPGFSQSKPERNV